MEGRLQGLKLRGETLEGKEFENCTFVSCDLAEARLSRCRFLGCELRSSELSLLKPAGSAFRDVRFVDCRLLGVDWTEVDAALGLRLAFERCVLDSSSFMALHLEELRMVDCTARELGFEGAVLTGATFSSTNLEGSRFHGTDLRGADLSDATGVAFDPSANRLGRTRLSLEGGLAVLGVAGIVIPQLEEGDE